MSILADRHIKVSSLLPLKFPINSIQRPLLVVLGCNLVYTSVKAGRPLDQLDQN